MSEQSIVPVEQKQVLFYDDEITAVRAEDGTVYVPIRPLCAQLGIAWTAQRQRILRDPVLAENMRPVIVTITGTGQEVESLCLPLDFVNGWLFGINANRVKEELRERIIQYQRNCYRVLAEAFRDGRLTTEPSSTPPSSAQQAVELLEAMLALARQQVVLEQRVDDHGRRLELLEAQFGDESRAISQDQAMQISQAVKAVALVMSKQSGRNEYGGVYGEFYRKFAITSYKLLPASRFQEAVDWLTDWHQQLTGDAPF